MERIGRGDPSALAELYDRHAATLYALARRILGSVHEAEDLVHDVFIEVWRNAATFDASRAGVVTWLVVRLRSRAIDRLRRRVRESGPGSGEPSTADLDPSGPVGGEEGERSVDRRRARAALAALPLEQRAVVELAYFEGATFAEIAQRLSIPISTAKSRLVAAVRALRRALGQTDESDR